MPKIKSITTTIHHNFTPEQGLPAFYEERDAQQNVLLQLQYDSTGELESRVVRSFDEQGKLVEELQYSQNDVPDQVISTSYDAAGRPAQQKIKYLDGSYSFRNYTRDEAANSETITTIDEENFEEGKEFRRYDSEGRTLEEVIEEEGEPIQEIETTYDDHGRPLTQSGYYKDDYEFDRVYSYQLDEQGRIAQAEVHSEVGELLRRETYRFDERGNLCEQQIESFADGVNLTNSWEHDLDNRMTLHRRTLPGGNLQSEVQYRYDERGLLAEEERLSPEGVSLLVYAYELW